MKKIHTRVKRRLGLKTHKNPYYFFHPTLIKRRRSKSFKTEEAANNWALNHGLKPDEYSLKEKRNNKFQIEVENGKDKNNIGKKNSS